MLVYIYYEQAFLPKPYSVAYDTNSGHKYPFLGINKGFETVEEAIQYAKNMRNAKICPLVIKWSSFALGFTSQQTMENVCFVGEKS